MQSSKLLCQKNTTQFFLCDSKCESISQKDPQGGLVLDSLLPIITKKDRQTFAAEELVLTTQDGVAVPAIFINNHSDRVVVLGASCLQDALHKMNSFAARLIQSGYDIMMFDYRWHSQPLRSTVWSSLFGPIEQLVEKEKNEVTAVIKYLKEYNPSYKDIVGLGQCYSCYTFAAAQIQAQKNGESCFTKLIFESPWLSLWSVMEASQQEPQVCVCETSPDANPYYIKSIMRFPLIKWPINLLKKIFCYFSPETSIIRYIKEIKDVPILFIYGQDDIEVPVNHFNRIWTATTTPKATLVVPGGHTKLFHNDDNKKMYMHVVNNFIQSPFNLFFDKLAQEIMDVR